MENNQKYIGEEVLVLDRRNTHCDWNIVNRGQVREETEHLVRVTCKWKFFGREREKHFWWGKNGYEQRVEVIQQAQG